MAGFRGICSVGLWRQCLALKMRRRGEELEIHISPGWEAKVGVRLWKHQKEMGQSPDWRGWNSKLKGSEVHSVGQEKVSQSLAALYLMFPVSV